jgi:hypothetical protein
MVFFPIGSIVTNFGALAMVVGHFEAADGQLSDYDGHLVLRELSADGRRFKSQGKWIADPAKCQYTR